MLGSGSLILHHSSMALKLTLGARTLQVIQYSYISMEVWLNEEHYLIWLTMNFKMISSITLQVDLPGEIIT
jgi:hypothetical protein